MPTIRWKAGNAGSVPNAIVQVSRLELAHARDVPGFLVAALRLRHVALTTSGAIGISLKADPVRKTFWTPSAWDRQESLTRFVRHDAHRAVMVRYAHRMNSSHFRTWTRLESATETPDWGDALRRFDASITSPSNWVCSENP